MNRHLIAFSFLLVAGCASAPPDPVTTASVKPQNCEREYRTGSMLPMKECTPTLTEAERQRLVDELRVKIRSTGSAPPGP